MITAKQQPIAPSAQQTADALTKTLALFKKVATHVENLTGRLQKLEEPSHQSAGGPLKSRAQAQLRSRLFEFEGALRREEQRDGSPATRGTWTHVFGLFQNLFAQIEDLTGRIQNLKGAHYWIDQSAKSRRQAALDSDLSALEFATRSESLRDTKAPAKGPWAASRDLLAELFRSIENLAALVQAEQLSQLDVRVADLERDNAVLRAAMDARGRT